MKVEGPKPLQNVNRTQRAGKANATSKGEFSKHLTEETSATSATSAASGVFGVDALLGLQEVDDVLHRHKKAAKHGSDILDQLDGLRLMLLEGRVNKDRLIQLAQMVQTKRTQVTDPRLTAILDDIDLRAQVELAKLMP